MAARIGRFDPLMRGKTIPANRVLPAKVANPPDFLRNQADFWQGQKDSNSRHAVLEWLLKREQVPRFGRLSSESLRFDALLMMFVNL